MNQLTLPTRTTPALPPKSPAEWGWRLFSGGCPTPDGLSPVCDHYALGRGVCEQCVCVDGGVCLFVAIPHPSDMPGTLGLLLCPGSHSRSPPHAPRHTQTPSTPLWPCTSSTSTRRSTMTRYGVSSGGGSPRVVPFPGLRSDVAHPQIINALEEDPAAQKMQLAFRLQQIAAALENKVTDL